MRRLLKIVALLSALMLTTGGRVSTTQYRVPKVVTFGEFLHARARHYGIPDSVAFGVIMDESSWDVTAYGKAGEIGLWQLSLETAREISGNPRLTEKQLFDPFVNTELGLLYLATQKHKCHSNMRLALASYNSGPGTVRDALASGDTVPMGYANRVLRFARQAMRANLQVPVEINGSTLMGVS